MKKPFEIKVWDVLDGGNYIACIIDKKRNQMRTLFKRDGSGSWWDEPAIYRCFQKTSTKKMKVRLALKKANQNGYMDNLSYIEYLHKYNERIQPK
jgi:hypothetical protein